MFVITGVMGVLVGLGGYLFPIIRNAEDILPDHDVVTKTAVLQNRVQDLTNKRSELKQMPSTKENNAALAAISRELRQIGQEYQQVMWKKG